MKQFLCYVALLILPFQAIAQEQEFDETAILLLDRMSQVIGDLSSCSFTLNTSIDVPDNTFFVPIDGIGLVKHFAVHEVYFSGFNKLLVQSHGDKGHRGFWYNGLQLAYYSYDENNYAVMEAPDSTVNMMYALHERYGIEFPAADFFNPYFTDDLIQQSSQIRFLGASTVEGIPCFSIIATSPEMIIQLWITNDAMNLPLKMVIIYRDQEDNPQYEATFSNWGVNPDLPDAIFDFLPPAQSSKIAVTPRIVD